MIIDHAIILAAGRGTRMIPLTDLIPKAMANYQGSTLIARGIGKIKDQVPNIHITVGYKKEMLSEHVITKNVSSIINTEGKGNAWWLYNSLMKHINDPVIVLTCDNIVELDIAAIAKNYRELGSPACMLIPAKPIEGLEGDYIFKAGNIVTELDRNKASESYCSGIQVLNPCMINRITESTEDFYDVWKQLILKGRLICSDIYPKQWFTVDTIEQLKQANLL